MSTTPAKPPDPQHHRPDQQHHRQRRAGDQPPETEPPRKVDPFTFVLHGAAGDLARRKILPALAHLAESGYFPQQCRIVLAQRRPVTAAEALAEQAAFLREIGDDAAVGALAALTPLVSTVAIALGSDVAATRALLAAAVDGGPRPVVHYAALPASRFADLMALIDGPRDPAQLRVVLEKPLGFSGDESRRIEDVVAEHLDEAQVYRIDHYLGKQAVQNLLALRLGNLVFEPLFNREHVAHVEITVAEHLGVEDRAGFYEQSGAIRDMVQSHMLQLLATLAMEPPVGLDADALRDEKLKILRSLAVPRIGGRDSDIVIGQYVGGHFDGRVVPGYRQEPGVARDSLTESFVAFRTEVRTWRWAGVPFLLRTGKRMPQRFAEIVVQFRDVPLPLYKAVGGQWAGNRLVVRLQPEDQLQLHLLAKAPGQRERLQPVKLNLDFFEAWRIPVRDAYERLLTDILRGRLSLFLRRDEVEAQWSFTDQLRTQIHDGGLEPLAYAAGTFGPPEATALAVRAGAVWSEALAGI
ncbi:MAG: glucose-6-phosphate dehydrogenase [Lautropia sp.]